ncbi:hypothetical protein CUMW_271710, partial [Citrus unshiu]
MLTSLEFIVEERNILRDYCDASSAPSPGGLAVIYQPQLCFIFFHFFWKSCLLIEYN